MKVGESIEYRDFTITRILPPIPTRKWDYEAVHKDYDGPEDNGLLHESSIEKAKEAVDEWYEFNNN